MYKLWHLTKRYTMDTVNRIRGFSSITKEMDPKEFYKIASQSPSKIKRSRFMLPKRFGQGLKAKVLVEFENGK